MIVEDKNGNCTIIRVHAGGGSPIFEVLVHPGWNNWRIDNISHPEGDQQMVTRTEEAALEEARRRVRAWDAARRLGA